MTDTVAPPKPKFSTKFAFEIQEISGIPTEKSSQAIMIFNEERCRQGFRIYAARYEDGHFVKAENDGSHHSFYVRVPIGRFGEIIKELKALTL